MACAWGAERTVPGVHATYLQGTPRNCWGDLKVEKVKVSAIAGGKKNDRNSV